MKSILVIGASGSLGRKTCEALLDIYNGEILLLVGDYRKDRGEETAKKLSLSVENVRCVNVKDAASVAEGITADIDCVIVAVTQAEPIVQGRCVEKGIPCVDLTTFSDFSAKVQKKYTDSATPLVMMAGFFPGISGILVGSLAGDFDQVDGAKVSLLQNKNANVGISGMADMLNIISKPLPNGEPGFRNNYSESFENDSYMMKEIAHDEIAVLQDKLSISKISYYTAWNKRGFNSMIAFLVRTKQTGTLIRIMKRFNISLDNDALEEEAFLKVRVFGTIDGKKAQKSIEAKVFSDYGITGYGAAIAAKILAERNDVCGVVYPLEFLSVEDLSSLVELGKMTITN